MKNDLKLLSFIPLVLFGFLLSIGGGVIGAAASDRLTAIFNVGQGAAGTKAMVFDSGNSSSNAQVGSTANTNLNLGTGGSTRLTASSAGVTVAGQYLGPLSTAGAPLYSFTGDTDTGIYSSSANILDLAAAGADFLSGNGTQLDINTNILNVNSGPVRAPTSSSGAPAYSFLGDTNTGIYQAGADTIGFSTGGTATNVMDITGMSTEQGAGGSFIKWHIYSGSLTTLACTANLSPGGTILGAIGYTERDSIGPTGWKPMDVGYGSHCGLGNADQGNCLTDSTSTSIKVCNYDNTTDSYIAIAFYQ